MHTREDLRNDVRKIMQAPTDAEREEFRKPLDAPIVHQDPSTPAEAFINDAVNTAIKQVQDIPSLDYCKCCGQLIRNP